MFFCFSFAVIHKSLMWFWLIPLVKIMCRLISLFDHYFFPQKNYIFYILIIFIVCANSSKLSMISTAVGVFFANNS